ncbi:MAG: hypothetical protein F6K42_15730 [Leptolyngbya sp. SIO1D8]|nr:hypothetical protein [Leptolyngbya sp. SIO1D8]
MTPSSSGTDWQAFDTDLKQVEVAVQALRQRFDQIRSLQQQQQQLEQQIQSSNLSIEELQPLKRQLDELEVQLESALFDWRLFQEPFWQAVRFGGIGVTIGWLLKGIASN